MADLSSHTPIYIRTTGDDTTGDGSLGSPFATAQKGFDTAIATSSGDYVLDFGAGSFGGVVLAQDWPARIAVRGVGVTQSFLGGVSGNGVALDLSYYQDEDGNWVTNGTNAGDGRNITIIGNDQINIGNVSAIGGNSVYLYSAFSGYWADTGDFSIQARVGNGGNVSLQNVTAGNIDALSGINSGPGGSDYYDYGSTGGDVTLSDVAAGNINTTARSYAFAPYGAESNKGGAVSLTNSVVGNITADGAGDGSAAGSGGAITALNSTCGIISSSSGFAESVPGTGGAIFLTNSTSGAIICNGSWSAHSWVYDPNLIIGPGGSVTLTSSTCGHITCKGGPGAVYNSSGSVVLTDSQSGNIDVSGSPPGTYWWGSFGTSNTSGVGGDVTLTNSSSGNINLTGGTSSEYGSGDLGTATYTGTSFNDDTVTGNAVFNDSSFNAGTVSGAATYNGFTGTNSYGTFVNGQQIYTLLYFNGAVDSEWATLGNWWLDEACTIPAPELPSSATDVVVTATIYDATYAPREVRSLEVYGTASVAVIGGLTVVQTATAYDYSVIGGTLTGQCVFYDFSSAYDLSHIYGNASFYDSSFCSSSVHGDVDLHDSASINSTGPNVVYGTATFYDTSCAMPDGGLDADHCVFNDDSFSAVWSLNCPDNVFNDSSLVTSNCQVNGDAVFNDNSQNNGIVIGDATFTGNSANYGTIGDENVGSAISFYDSAINHAETTLNGGAITFYDSSFGHPSAAYLGNTTTSNRTPYPIPRGLGGTDVLGMI